uniref:RecF/RecN/SMC N-terminal domain-containing protein n=1 Tax=Kalanchoe fedtschenkoi TaxID=63787 RepID=A0A7N0UUA8_KALFE
MPSLPSPGKIHHLELENFKSYKGSQYIGPFYDFTAVIGPNGAGKSNLMDAISFVLGVRTGQLRGAQLRDLIYAYDDKEKEQSGRRAFVRLVYQMDTGAELRFTRTITGSGGSEYRLDNSVVTWDEYNAKLKSLGILVKARNFLVFQGDVESIASKNPKELTVLLEQISGSEELKSDYETLEQQKATAEENSALVYQRKRTITLERKQKKEQKLEAERHLKLQEDLKSLKRDYCLWQLLNIEKDISKISEELEAEKSVIEDIKEQKKSYENEANKKNKEQHGYLKEIARLEYEQKRDIASQITKLEASLKALENQLKEIKDKEDNAKKAMEETIGEINAWKEKVQQLKSEVEESEKVIQEWEKQISSAVSSINKLTRQMALKEAQIEQLISQKQGILEKCELEQITLPTVTDPMDIDSSTPGPVFDFDQLKLPSDMKRLGRAEIEAKFKQKIDNLTSDIERTAAWCLETAAIPP